MRALILAGGLGTRLRSALPDQPKVMAPIAGRPFLDYQLGLLRQAGITEVVLCVGYMSDQINSHFGDGERLGMRIRYSQETAPLGTAGAILNAARFLTEDSVVLNGDTYFVCDLKALIHKHSSARSVVTLALHPAPEDNRYGSVILGQDGRVLSFAEKENALSERLNGAVISGGTYVFSPKILELIPQGRSSSLETEVFPRVIAEGLPVYGIVDNGYFKDIGTPESWLEFERFILREKMEGCNDR